MKITTALELVHHFFSFFFPNTVANIFEVFKYSHSELHVILCQFSLDSAVQDIMALHVINATLEISARRRRMTCPANSQQMPETHYSKWNTGPMQALVMLTLVLPH